MKQQIRFVNRTGEPASGVRILFSPCRVSLLGYRVSHLPRGTSPIAVEVTRVGAELVWHPPLQDSQGLTLTVDYHGEPPVAETEVWWDAGGRVLAGPEADNPRRELLLKSRSMKQLAENVLESKRVRCDQLAGIAGSPNKRFHLFFCELDVQTNYALLRLLELSTGEFARRVGILDGLMAHLYRRIHQRRKAAHDHPGQPASGLDAWGYPEEIREMSKLQLDLYRKHLADPNSGLIDPDAVWQAFSLFANGALQQRPVPEIDWNSAPNSAAVFYFAEFAFMAVEAECDVDDWTRALPALVGMQEIYAWAYRPAVSKPRFRHYAQGSYSQGMTAVQLQDVRTRCEKLSLDDLRIEAGRNAQAAFPGGL